MNPGKLFVSFWAMGLDNLPEGTFMHFCIAADDARGRMAQAQQEGRLLCVTGDDLLAPYESRQREKHEELCRVLSEHFGIALSLDDFMGESEHEGKTYYSANPLNCVQVRDQDRLLVITCHYALKENGQASEPPEFEVVADTVEFHLIEAQAAKRP
jgi:hypothetical protein